MDQDDLFAQAMGGAQEPPPQQDVLPLELTASLEMAITGGNRSASLAERRQSLEQRRNSLGLGSASLEEIARGTDSITRGSASLTRQRTSQLIGAVAEELGGEMYLDQAQALIQAQRSGSMKSAAQGRNNSMERPTGTPCAEIIAVISSLKASPLQFYKSLRLIHFLSRKRVRYLLVDINKDVSESRQLANLELVSQWTSSNALLLNAAKRPIIPQCLIDGFAVGDEVEVQDLEEDNDFDFIVTRSRCASCLCDRRPDDSQSCAVCGNTIRPLVPPEIAATDKVYWVFNDDRVNYDAELPQPGQRISYVPSFRALEEAAYDEYLEYF